MKTNLKFNLIFLYFNLIISLNNQKMNFQINENEMSLQDTITTNNENELNKIKNLCLNLNEYNKNTHPICSKLDRNNNRICSGNGYYDIVTGVCSCNSMYYGNNCTLKYCPYGKSWLSQPIKNNQRYQPRVECSNMGSCDVNSGKCTCRKGFEGRACDRSMLLLFIIINYYYYDYY